MVIESPQTLFLDCEVGGSPLPLVEWTVNGSVLESDGMRVFIMEAGTISMLGIYNTIPADSGIYACRASTDVSTTEYAVPVVVHTTRSEWAERSEGVRSEWVEECEGLRSEWADRRVRSEWVEGVRGEECEGVRRVRV